jgi:hypothetical protein
MKHLEKYLAGLGIALASCVLTPGVATAQDAPPPDNRGEPGQIQPGTILDAEKAAPANTLDVHGLIGVDFPTAYISRGLVLEDQGFIAQPYGEIGFTLYEGEGTFSKVTAFGGIWNSLHSNHTDAGLASGATDSTTPAWYEFDWYGGFAFDFAEKWNLNLSYWEFLSPNDGFGTSRNVQAKIAYNDAGAWGGGDFALKPYFIVFVETDGKAGSGSDEGIYFEVGVEPTVYTVGESAAPLSLSIPIKVGLGANDFYEDDETFGFATVGIKASLPLTFMPAEYGAWSGYAGVYYYLYGDGVDDFNEGAGDGDDDIVFAAGVSMTF